MCNACSDTDVNTSVKARSQLLCIQLICIVASQTDSLTGRRRGGGIPSPGLQKHAVAHVLPKQCHRPARFDHSVLRLLHMTPAGTRRPVVHCSRIICGLVAVCSDSDLASSTRACRFHLSSCTCSRNVRHTLFPFVTNWPQGRCGNPKLAPRVPQPQNGGPNKQIEIHRNLWKCIGWFVAPKWCFFLQKIV